MKCKENAKELNRFIKLYEQIKQHKQEPKKISFKKNLTGGHLRKRKTAGKAKRNKYHSKKMKYMKGGSNSESSESSLLCLDALADRNIDISPIISYYKSNFKNDDSICENMNDKYKSIDKSFYDNINQLDNKLWTVTLEEKIMNNSDTQRYPRKIKYEFQMDKLTENNNLIYSELERILNDKTQSYQKEDSYFINRIYNTIFNGLSKTYNNNDEESTLENIRLMIQIGNILKYSKNINDNDSLLNFRTRLYDITQHFVQSVIKSGHKDKVQSLILNSKLGPMLKRSTIDNSDEIHSDIKGLLQQLC